MGAATDTEKLQRRNRELVFTAFDIDERIVSAVRAGASGYLLKGAPREALFNAIRVVSGGGSLLRPLVASRLMQRIAAAPEAPGPDALTEREQQVLRLLLALGAGSAPATAPKPRAVGGAAGVVDMS